jgi:hypothetical protein
LFFFLSFKSFADEASDLVGKQISEGTKRQYESKLKKLKAFFGEHSVSPIAPYPLESLLPFFASLQRTNITPNTIAGFRAAIVWEYKMSNISMNIIEDNQIKGLLKGK